MIAYFNGRYLPKEEIKISPDDRGFLFADGVYEVIRAYGGKPFKMEEHLQRLARSLKEIRIDYPAVAELAAVGKKLIAANHLSAGEYATLYIQITRGAASSRKHPFPDEPVPPTVYVAAFPGISQKAKIENGVKIILVPDIRWSRCDIKSISLLPNVLANQQAKENGAEEAVFVRDGVITEGSHTNFFMVFEGRVLTHPLNGHILPGVTREIIRDLCAGLNLPFREALVSEKDLPRAEEMFLSGTSMEVTPVIQVDNRKVGRGGPGPVTVRLREAYKKMLDDFMGSGNGG
jgi:D-alanine transaminase